MSTKELLEKACRIYTDLQILSVDLYLNKTEFNGYEAHMISETTQDMTGILKEIQRLTKEIEHASMFYESKSEEPDEWF